MPFSTHRPLPAEIKQLQDRIEAKAAEYGLDFFDTVFEMVDYDEMSMLAAYGGFPVRYPHWRFGAEYDEMMKSYSYGLSKIYEMVINTDPCYAYLLTANELADQKLVIAHVYGHCDFFKQNAWFSKTNRRMLDQMANHAARVNRYVDRFGYEEVEKFIDRCLSVEDLIDPHLPFATPREEVARQAERERKRRETAPPADRFEAKPYMDGFVNPREALEAGDRARKARDEAAEDARKFPERPERDVLLFLLDHAPLKDWQHDVLSIIRDEAYYYFPQGQTKIMNEGWACTDVHCPVFTDRGLRPMGDVVERQRTGGRQAVGDGSTVRGVYDSHVIRDVETITLRTRRGLELTGSTNHRVLAADGETWRRLDELAVKDRLAVAAGGVWPNAEAAIDWAVPERVTLADVAAEAGVPLREVHRVRYGFGRSENESAVRTALLAFDTAANQALPSCHHRRTKIQVPEVCDERLANFLGHLVGDGHISRVKRQLGLTTGDWESADRFADLAEALFDVRPVVKCDREGMRLRVLIHSETLADFLVEGLGLTSGKSAERKRVPDCVLRSPERVVAAFLRGLFDADGYAGKQGVILSSRSDEVSSKVQLLLLNMGVLTRRRRQSDGCWHVHAAGGVGRPVRRGGRLRPAPQAGRAGGVPGRSQVVQGGGMDRRGRLPHPRPGGRLRHLRGNDPPLRRGRAGEP